MIHGLSLGFAAGWWMHTELRLGRCVGLRWAVCIGAFLDLHTYMGCTRATAGHKQRNAVGRCLRVPKIGLDKGHTEPLALFLPYFLPLFFGSTKVKISCSLVGKES